MREKRATEMDKGAHKIMEFWTSKSAETYDDARYKATYHEDRLYSVYDTKREMVTLVYANNGQDAIEQVRNGGIVMNVRQMGSNGTVIGHVNHLTL